jgi:hypothetical protein
LTNCEIAGVRRRQRTKERLWKLTHCGNCGKQTALPTVPTTLGKLEQDIEFPTVPTATNRHIYLSRQEQFDLLCERISTFLGNLVNRPFNTAKSSSPTTARKPISTSATTSASPTHRCRRPTTGRPAGSIFPSSKKSGAATTLGRRFRWCHTLPTR